MTGLMVPADTGYTRSSTCHREMCYLCVIQKRKIYDLVDKMYFALITDALISRDRRNDTITYVNITVALPQGKL